MTTATSALDELHAAAEVVHDVLPRTPQYAWPLLGARTGAEVWVKHENHLPIGAFKVRGGLVYFAELRRSRPHVRDVIAATRGNHGQSIAFAARRYAMTATIVVPHGNSAEKNAAMRALGAELIEAGEDFNAALETARRLAEERGAHLVPSYHPALVRGVASAGLELFGAVHDIDAVYVPIGQGSGAAALIAARDALGLRTHIIGVVAAAADAYARSFEAGRAIATETAATIADGVACRVPDPAAFAVLKHGLARIVRVSDEAICDAMRVLFSDTHNVAEGAGAAALAALLQERAVMRGRRVAVMLTGGNIDRAMFADVMAR
ncbi:MAG: threonine dehydratase [Candidatus Velthaea sp.]